MQDSGVKIEIHLIQNFGPSNLNRDDTGQPKSANFGGFRRARVSSQCSKRSIREWWRVYSKIDVGERTKKLQELIFNELAEDEEFKERKLDEKTMRDGIRLFTDAYYAAADKKKRNKTNVLVFIGPDELDACREAIKETWEENPQATKEKGQKSRGTDECINSVLKKLTEFEKRADKETDEDSAGDKKSRKPKLKGLSRIEDRIRTALVSPDIALFGRMLAEHPGRNTDGSCQVAHPISTHKVDMEMDFYTAVDDLNPEEETGAGMMGVIGYNSACYYRYALVDRDQLARNLSRKTERNTDHSDFARELTPDDYKAADEVIKAFLEAMVYAIPTGKKNSFAQQQLPSFGMFVRRQGGVPLSLANAFTKPVRPTMKDDDLVGLSVDRLTKHWSSLKKVYGEQGVIGLSFFHVDQDEYLNGLAPIPEPGPKKDADGKPDVINAIDAIVSDNNNGRKGE